MWKASVGFNASHSYGAILFGLVYGYLAVAQSSFLFQSPFLLRVGLCVLAGYVFLSKVYWFSVPFRGIVLSMVFYVAAPAITWARSTRTSRRPRWCAVRSAPVSSFR